MQIGVLLIFLSIWQWAVLWGTYIHFGDGCPTAWGARTGFLSFFLTTEQSHWPGPRHIFWAPSSFRWSAARHALFLQCSPPPYTLTVSVSRGTFGSPISNLAYTFVFHNYFPGCKRYTSHLHCPFLLI